MWLVVWWLIHFRLWLTLAKLCPNSGFSDATSLSHDHGLFGSLTSVQKTLMRWWDLGSFCSVWYWSLVATAPLGFPSLHFMKEPTSTPNRTDRSLQVQDFHFHFPSPWCSKKWFFITCSFIASKEANEVCCIPLCWFCCCNCCPFPLKMHTLQYFNA